MATYWPPKKNTAFIMYVGLESVATAGTFQSSPTLASGDFKVSIDGGTLANLTTLPTVTPTGGKMVKISLSSSEMNGDNITVVCSDAAGSEWKDLIINLATVANQNDDLATPTNITAGTIANVTNAVNVGSINGSSTAAAQLALSAATIVNGAATATTLSTTQMSTNLTNATNDHYKGRVLIWTSGTLQNQAAAITAYNGTSKTLTFTTTTGAPSNGDTFIIV